jgi:ABC-2 type transport system ATP-binding protein
MPTPALELRALTKRYDGELLALDAFDLVVGQGEFFGLLGPNGAGKTRPGCSGTATTRWRPAG